MSSNHCPGGPEDKKDRPVAESQVPPSPGTASSPATTVPASDEEARSMALASYEQSKSQNMQTPEDKIRRAPATPHTSLVRISSQPIFSDPPAGKANQADPAAEKANQADPHADKASQADSRANKEPAQKNKKQQPKKTQKNKIKSQKGKKGVKKSSMKKNKGKGKGKKPNKLAEKKGNEIRGGKHLPPPATAAQAAETPASLPEQPVKQEPCQEPAPKQPKLERPASPEPDPATVQSMLNRAMTEDLRKHNAALPPGAAIGTAQATPCSTAAPNAPGAPAGQSAPPGKTLPGKIPPNDPPPPPPTLELRVGRKPRDKTLHNRRMRFYRSLDSFLPQGVGSILTCLSGSSGSEYMLDSDGFAYFDDRLICQ